MLPRKPGATPRAVVSLPVVFHVGSHVLTISFVAEGRWTVSVDGGPASQTYRAQVEAWEAGVRLADELDRPKPT